MTPTDLGSSKLPVKSLRIAARALDALHAPVAVVDADGAVVVANTAWHALFEGAVLSETASFEELLFAELPDGGAHREYSHPARPLRMFTMRAVQLPGSPAHRLLSCEDVTDSTRIADEVQRAQRDLAEVVAVSSHDLRTALRGIALLTRWIGEDIGPSISPDTKQHLDLLTGRVSRMEAMLEALLRYLRLGDLPEHSAEVDTGALLDAITRKLSRPAGITVSASTPMPTVLTQRSQLRQVLTELLENAIAHHDREVGAITVHAHDHDTHVQFCVHDDGPGFAERTQERIFKLFHTGGSRDPVRHVGVGLAVVKRLVEGQGGKVSVEALPTRGSAFCFTWPKQTVNP